jgi:hypothetical protein
MAKRRNGEYGNFQGKAAPERTKDVRLALMVSILCGECQLTKGAR